MLRTEKFKFAGARIQSAATLIELSHGSDSFPNKKLHLDTVTGKSVVYFPTSSEITRFGTGFAFSTRGGDEHIALVMTQLQ